MLEPTQKAHPYFQAITDAVRSFRIFFLGNSNCKYSIGCIDFVVDQFLSNPFSRWHIALKKSVERVISCNPFTKL